MDAAPVKIIGKPFLEQYKSDLFCILSVVSRGAKVEPTYIITFPCGALGGA